MFADIFEKSEEKRFHEEIAAKKASKKRARDRVELEATPDLFPDDFNEIHATRLLGGSSSVEAGFWNDKEQCLVVKKARQAETVEETTQYREQLQEEYVADAIYREMGFLVPESKIYNGGEAKVSSFIDGKQINVAGSYLKKDQALIQKELRRGFVLDCFLGNWDVIGEGEDNILIDADNKVYRIDNGGALRFRARGERKGEEFGGPIGELETMKRQAWFRGISRSEIRSQAEEVLEKRDQILECVQGAAAKAGMTKNSLIELMETLQKRFDFLYSHAHALEQETRKDKGEYESGVTNAYFETWEELELEGNPELKEAIKQGIIETEKRQEDSYKEHAAQRGISVEEYKSLLQERVEMLVEESRFFRATHADILEKIMLEDGRWKSQFETSTSNGLFYPQRRSQVENAMFGFANNVTENAGKRPIYGYFSNGENGEQNHEGTIPPPIEASQYGRVIFKLKKDAALRKATLCISDSLGYCEERRMAVTPASKPHFTSLKIGDDPLDQYWETRKTPHYKSYTEAQYHNQLTMEDIESIHLVRGNGLEESEFNRVRDLYQQYLDKHPESDLKLVQILDIKL